MLCLRRLRFSLRNHLPRTFVLNRRDMMLGINLFQSSLLSGNLSFQLVSLLGLNARTAGPIGAPLDFALMETNFFVHCFDRVNKTLSNFLFETQTADLARDLQP